MPAKRTITRERLPDIAARTPGLPSVIAKQRYDVQAVATWLASSDELQIAVFVTDGDGEPVLGLTKSRFRVWGLGIHTFDHTIGHVGSMHTFDKMEGHYRLTISTWSAPAFAANHGLCVQVLHNGRVAGTRLFSFARTL